MSNDLYLYTGDGRVIHNISIEYGDLFEFIDLDSILHIKSNTIISTNHIGGLIKYSKKYLNILINSLNETIESLNNAFIVLSVYKNIGLPPKGSFIFIKKSILNNLVIPLGSVISDLEYSNPSLHTTVTSFKFDNKIINQPFSMGHLYRSAVDVSVFEKMYNHYSEQLIKHRNRYQIISDLLTNF